MSVAGDSGSKYAAVGKIADDILSLMEDLYQSGFDTVHDSTIQGLESAVTKTERYGMKHLSGLLKELAEEISAGRHRMEKKTERTAELYTQINEYLYLCRQKVTYDYGMERYAHKNNIQEATI
ncbi:MAG: hypothetical protein NC305_18735 [Lachnospiraceae bacterium]|nr:hypothetical protein [Muribaculaceae bacterium]MCM1412557.1 hypothetical protein [Lachnospiraceae bacterium]